jgi:hypothetical protein
MIRFRIKRVFISVELKFDYHDLWMGIYWKSKISGRFFNIYICILPMLPIRIGFLTFNRDLPRPYKK